MSDQVELKAENEELKERIQRSTKTMQDWILKCGDARAERDKLRDVVEHFSKPKCVNGIHDAICYALATDALRPSSATKAEGE